jgi:hypothetical protein
LPDGYAVNNAFNFEDIRPWLDHEAHAFEPDYPAIEPHPSSNEVSLILDRRALRGFSHAGLDFLDIPCEYKVLRKSGDIEWIPASSSLLRDTKSGRNLLATFELRYPRDPSRPCNPVHDYPDDLRDGYVSDDEMPIAMHQDFLDRL